MKSLFTLALLALISTNALAEKSPMPQEVADELTNLVFKEITLPEVAEEAPVGTDGNVAQRAWGWLRRRAGDVQESIERQNERRRLEKERQDQVEALLGQYTLGQGWPEETLMKIADYMGVKTFPSFDALPAEERTAALNELMDIYSRLPIDLITTLKKRNRGIDVVADNVTTHPRMSSYRDSRPRGWAEGRTWSEVPGAGATGSHGTIIAANSLHKGHGSVDLVLHEVGHSIDRYFKNGGGSMDFSTTAMFTELNTVTPFEPLYGRTAHYQASNSEENFAEMFAMYFASESSRQHLQESFPEGYRYMNETFGN